MRVTFPRSRIVERAGPTPGRVVADEDRNGSDHGDAPVPVWAPPTVYSTAKEALSRPDGATAWP